MAKVNLTSHNGGLVAVVVIFVLLLSAAVGMFCWTYSINQWLAFFGKPPAVEWWQGALLGFVPYVGQASIPIAVATWVISLFV